MTPTSPPGHRPARRSSSTSRCSTTTSAVTRRWGTYPQPSTNGKTLNPLSTFRGELHARFGEELGSVLDCCLSLRERTSFRGTKGDNRETLLGIDRRASSPG